MLNTPSRSLGVLVASATLLAVSACSSSTDNDSAEEGTSMVDMEHGLLLEEFDEWQYALADDPDGDVPAFYDSIARLVPEGENDAVTFAMAFADDPMSSDELEDAMDRELYAHTSGFQLDNWASANESSEATTVSDYPAQDASHVVEGEDEADYRYSRLIMVAADDQTLMLFGFGSVDYRDDLDSIMDTLEVE